MFPLEKMGKSSASLYIFNGKTTLVQIYNTIMHGIPPQMFPGHDSCPTGLNWPHVGTRCGCTCADILAVKPLRRRCSLPPQKCHFSMATLLSCWPMSLLVAEHQWILSAHDTHTAHTRFKRLKYTLFQYYRWKWLLAYTPSTRPQSNISTAKSTYIDQITHVS